MTIEELQKRPEFVTLGSEQMKKWLVEYCSNGADKMKATEAAYNATTERSALATANRLLADPKIQQLVKEYFNQTDVIGNKTEALAIVWKTIKSTTDAEVLLDYLKLYGEWMGFKSEKSKPETPDTPKDEWALVEEMEKKK